jgi:hypothetical protein
LPMARWYKPAGRNAERVCKTACLPLRIMV